MSNPTYIAVEILRLDYLDAPQGQATRALIDTDVARLCLAPLTQNINSFSTGEIAQWVAQMWGMAYHAKTSQIVDCFIVADTPELGCASFLLVSHESLEDDLAAAKEAEDYLKGRFGSAVLFESNGARLDGEAVSLSDWAASNAEQLKSSSLHRRSSQSEGAIIAFSERRSSTQQSSNAHNTQHAPQRTTPPKQLTIDMITDGA